MNEDLQTCLLQATASSIWWITLEKQTHCQLPFLTKRVPGCLAWEKNQEHLETQTQQGHFPNTSHLILKCSVWALGAFLGGTVLPFHTNPKHVSWKTGAVPTTLTTCFSCLVDSEQSVPIQIKLLNTLFKDFHVTPKIIHAIIPFPLVLALMSKV